MIESRRDAFGHAIWDYYRGRHVEEAGRFGCRTWFSEYDRWFQRERRAIARVRGRVLDIGCAAGRHALYLQARGHDVLAIDRSPLTIRVCRRRGVRRARVLAVTQVSYRLGVFDTVLMLGNNFGLAGNLARGRWLLRRFKRMTPPDGLILAGSGYFDMARASDAIRRQLAQNLARGRLPGAFRLRPQYRHYTSPPLDWLYASPEHMRRIVSGTGWHVAECIEDGTGAFVGILRKEPGK